MKAHDFINGIFGRNKEAEEFEELEEKIYKNPEIHRGLVNVCREWNRFCSEHDNLDFDDDLEWLEENHFTILCSRTSGELLSVRTRGVEMVFGGFYIFRTDYIPVNVDGPVEPNELRKLADEAVDCFERETLEMIANGERPILLIENVGDDYYYGWSIMENRAVNIPNYKSYRADFGVLDANTLKEMQPGFTGNYVIIPPSKEFIQRLGLHLCPDNWENSTGRDDWKTYEPMNYRRTVHEDNKHIYVIAVSLINIARVVDLGLEEEFLALEDSVDKYLSYDKFDTPSALRDKEAETLATNLIDILEKLDCAYIET